MPPNTEPISAGPLIRLLVLFLVAANYHKYLRWITKPSPGLMFIFNMCIKVKLVATLAEAHAMRFVAEHTSVPVPKIYCALFMNGKMVCQGWRSRSEESKSRIYTQLRRMITEIRSIPAPEGTSVGSVDGGPFCDCRLPSSLLWGPFCTTRDFHQALANESNSRPVLTHGDLSCLNILIEGDDVVGIVDWEIAGWLPPYWEYTCAKNVNPMMEFRAEEVDKILEPMPHELEMERIKRKYFGDT
ncbi:kinase-like domain-containing protein [Dichotomopilus funicola]|uniref:Kinase-like domain-containing protein n=1 Tax=Dichotomopilus funicola TaxID=1934379 RepID=A0AAN6UVV9_9PEZI|nr:kinase-like domain-containing protein [Dichotomopilus funicola]